VIYFCLSFCRNFNKLLSQIDDEDMGDMFDLLIVSSLTSKEVSTRQNAKKVYIDQTDL
jgi:hypothetical protein